MRISIIALLLLLSLVLVSCCGCNLINDLANQSDGEKISPGEIETLYVFLLKETNDEGLSDVVMPSQEDKEKVVYWTESGSVYHTDPECSTYSRSKEKVTGTLENAIRLGKSKQCSSCQNNSSNNSQGDKLYDNP